MSNMTEPTCERPEICAEPVAIEKPSHREVNVRRVTNGFIIKVGCQTFVTKTWNEASDGLAEYWHDPVAAEKKFCAA